MDLLFSQRFVWTSSNFRPRESAPASGGLFNLWTQDDQTPRRHQNPTSWPLTVALQEVVPRTMLLNQCRNQLKASRAQMEIRLPRLLLRLNRLCSGLLFIQPVGVTLPVMMSSPAFPAPVLNVFEPPLWTARNQLHVETRALTQFGSRPRVKIKSSCSFSGSNRRRCSSLEKEDDCARLLGNFQNPQSSCWVTVEGRSAHSGRLSHSFERWVKKMTLSQTIRFSATQFHSSHYGEMVSKYR